MRHGTTEGFQRNEALSAGHGVFWRQGYNATPTEDLPLAMGVGRQGFYDTFGDKRRCYLDALRTYVVEEVAGYIATLRGFGAPLDGLRNLLLTHASWDAERCEEGCMAMNALSEFGARNPEVAAVLAPAKLMFQQGSVALLAEEKAKGDVPNVLDGAQAAGALACTRAGMLVAAKGGMSATELREVADTTVDRLRG